MNHFSTKPLSRVVADIGKINFEGNIIPHAWYTHPLLRTPAGGLHFAAMHVLANLIYWYRPVVERDEMTQEVVRVRNKFSGERYRIDYAEWARYLGITKRQVQDAVAFLNQRGVVVRDVVDAYEVGRVRYYNAVLVHPVAAVIAELSEPKVGEDTLTFQRDTPPDEGAGNSGPDTPLALKRDTPYVLTGHPLTTERGTPHVETGAVNGDLGETTSETFAESKGDMTGDPLTNVSPDAPRSASLPLTDEEKATVCALEAEGVSGGRAVALVRLSLAACANYAAWWPSCDKRESVAPDKRGAYLAQALANAIKEGKSEPRMRKRPQGPLA